MRKLLIAGGLCVVASGALAQGLTRNITPAASVSGLATVATSGSASDLSTGTIPNARLALPDYGSGCTLSRSAATTVGIAACATADDTTFVIMPSNGRLAAYTKTLSAWAVGTGNGCLDTGALGATKFIYLYQIQRADTGVVDYLCTITYGTPTTPANYGRKRFIGSVPMDGSGNILAFTQIGNRVVLSAAVAELSNVVVNTTPAVTLTLAGVPNGHRVLGHFRATIQPGGSANAILYSSLDETDVAVAQATSTLHATTTSSTVSGAFDLMTNAAQAIRYRIAVAAVSNHWLNTVGWTDPLIAWPH